MNLLSQKQVSSSLEFMITQRAINNCFVKTNKCIKQNKAHDSTELVGGLYVPQLRF